mgnify:CR=1 FL=1
MTRKTPNKKKAKPINQQLTSSTKDAFAWWKDKTFIRKTDSIWMKIGKVLLQILGIIALIFYSPLLLLALLIAFFIAL